MYVIKFMCSLLQSVDWDVGIQSSILLRLLRDGLKISMYGGLEVPRSIRQALWTMYESNMRSLWVYTIMIRLINTNFFI